MSASKFYSPDSIFLCVTTKVTGDLILCVTTVSIAKQLVALLIIGLSLSDNELCTCYQLVPSPPNSNLFLNNRRFKWTELHDSHQLIGCLSNEIISISYFQPIVGQNAYLTTEYLVDYIPTLPLVFYLGLCELCSKRARFMFMASRLIM